MKITPVIRPGRVSKEKAKMWSKGEESEIEIVKDTLTKETLKSSVNRHARKMKMNRMERKPPRSPPSATTLQTPTLEKHKLEL